MSVWMKCVGPAVVPVQEVTRYKGRGLITGRLVQERERGGIVGVWTYGTRGGRCTVEGEHREIGGGEWYLLSLG